MARDVSHRRIDASVAVVIAGIRRVVGTASYVIDRLRRVNPLDERTNVHCPVARL